MQATRTMRPNLKIAINALGQLGVEPLALYALYQVGLKTGHYRRIETAVDRQASHGGLRLLIPLPSAQEVRATLETEGLETLLKEADEIVGGDVRLFGAERVPLRFSFDQPLQHWTAYATGKAAVPYSGAAAEDIKFLWEPARFGWALTLGRAYHLTGNEQYAES